jgi:glucose-6-phosphate dehydrogenase assembly protein OpcA
MAIVYKVLGQSNPSATTQTTLYTVPASTSAVVSTVTITNLAGTDATFRLAVRPAGETLANKHYITYDTTVPANDMVALTLGVTLATTDVVACYASTANVSFSIFGSEIS